MRRVTLARVRATYPEATVPRFTRDVGSPSTVRSVEWGRDHDALLLRITTGHGRWGVASGGVVTPERRLFIPLRECGGDEAVALARQEWGGDAGAVIRLALETGMDHGALRVLDIAGRADPAGPAGLAPAWLPGTAEIASDMLAAPAEARVPAGVRCALSRGMAREDLAALGLVD